MTKTYEALASHLKVARPYICQPGRESKHVLKDPVDQGRDIMDKDNDSEITITDDGEVDAENPDSVDIISELVD
jgi:hypothetical protein